MDTDGKIYHQGTKGLGIFKFLVGSFELGEKVGADERGKVWTPHPNPLPLGGAREPDASVALPPQLADHRG